MQLLVLDSFAQRLACRMRQASRRGLTHATGKQIARHSQHLAEASARLNRTQVDCKLKGRRKPQTNTTKWCPQREALICVECSRPSVMHVLVQAAKVTMSWEIPLSFHKDNTCNTRPESRPNLEKQKGKRSVRFGQVSCPSHNTL